MANDATCNSGWALLDPNYSHSSPHSHHTTFTPARHPAAMSSAPQSHRRPLGYQTASLPCLMTAMKQQKGFGTSETVTINRCLHPINDDSPGRSCLAITEVLSLTWSVPPGHHTSVGLDILRPNLEAMRWKVSLPNDMSECVRTHDTAPTFYDSDLHADRDPLHLPVVKLSPARTLPCPHPH